MPRPSRIILLVEDSIHERFIFRYLRNLGFGHHAMRIEKSPSGAGSAEQWVRERVAIEVSACRRRHAETRLVVIVDADNYTVAQRTGQLNAALREAGVAPIAEEDRIARLIPKRNIETWILCLNGVVVNEDADYKPARDNWTELIGTGVSTLYAWTRQSAPVQALSVESLRSGVRELQRTGLNEKVS